MRVTDTDLLIVVEAEPAEEQNKRDLPIIAEGRSRNMRPFFVCVCGGGGGEAHSCVVCHTSSDVGRW